LSAVTTTDVLIVGGGIGGLTAAIKAKEQDPSLDVLIVEKQTVGWAGKATKIGGILAFLAPGNDAGTFIDFQVRTAGAYLNDQDLLAKYVQATYGAIEELAGWGATVPRTPTGDLVTIPAFWAPDYSLTFIDIDLMLPLRKRARKLGVRMLSKIHVVDLLKQEDRVVGATGFDIVDGSFHELRAKATILANGSCGYKVRRFWVAGTGDGIAAAYRAGAEMRNAEYGNLYGHTVYQDTDSGLVPYVHLVNAQEENLAKKYLDDSGPAGVFLPLELIVGMEKEVIEGRGPIYFAPPPGPGYAFDTGMPKLTEWMQRMIDKETKYGLPAGTRREIGVPLHGETSCVKVDHEMRTSVEGLWAIGDTSYAGSAVAGAVASPPGITPGSGIMFAVISAAWAGCSAAGYAAEVGGAEVPRAEVEELEARTFAPLQRSDGLPPEELISAIQDVTAPIKYNIRRSDDRLREALDGVEAVKEKLPALFAKDTHYLSKCHEVSSMALCAELTFRAALARTESRGFHFREDYPVRDDGNWLKWVILKKAGDEVEVSTEPIPIGGYETKPA
jgi:succinate dehydrogenase/fumarate reductase flavoprotein subunit